MNDSLSDTPFSFAEGRDKVMIQSRGRIVKTLKGYEAQKFLARIEGLAEADAQLLMARVTGQFKFGNERATKK